MENKFIPYPKQIKVGGTPIDINDVDRIGDGILGQCAIHLGKIEIAQYVGRNDEPTEASKRQRFFHELTHSILGTMKHEMNNEEEFVSTFSSFLTEAMADAKFIDKEDME